ncbi:hypothetical protein K2173_005963 [Erythroxylum novogranatense]|uniref:Uncharacterized protein n=1 Tax=Erythroxylum novogranatense TaxID=1862640 RepID=A0AAV8TS78_9ROSI|nr:hypothetical protein K2173_005963 [Erythroxylum novogranatense]
MKSSGNNNSNNINGNSNANGLVPNSLKFISSCIKTASFGVRSAASSVAASISRDNKDQLLWASFDKLELLPSSFRHVLLLGYYNGFQVIDVQDASNVTELVSRRDDPVTFLQMQPLPAKCEGCEGFRASHPILVVVACDELQSTSSTLGGKDGFARDGYNESQAGILAIAPTIVRFYSLRSHNYVHVLRFRSAVYMVRCSPQIVAIGLATQIYCFDALTLENKLSVLTYPVPQLGSQGMVGVNLGCGPMAVGPRWLAYASDNLIVPNTGRLSPQNLTPLGVSPSTPPGSGNLMARYAMGSSKQLATGLINLGDMGFKTLSRYYQDLMPDGFGSPTSLTSSWKVGRIATHSTELDTAGMVVVKDFTSRAVVSQFRAHSSPISALCFDPSGTLLVTASIHGHNINIFRIMLSKCPSGSGNDSYDWNASHVHLYKLHRGITSAVIQDICFSHYSQWIAIVSSRGTCHIFVLSPFGGGNILQIQNSHADGPIFAPVLSLPWWSTPSFLANQQSLSSSPPSLVTLSVVSRIKNNNSGWLNTVSNAASSAARKLSVPSGAIAAIFHSCVPHDLNPTHSKRIHSLEHLLVYSPSGHVVQYKLTSSLGVESSESASPTGPGSSIHRQDEELQVNVEYVQCWDVCEGALARKGRMHFWGYYCEVVKHEVQMSSWRMPIWQKQKMYFYEMSPSGASNRTVTEDLSGGEIEIEKVHVQEIEIRRKDLLPVFDRSHRAPSNWTDRSIAGERNSRSSSGSLGVEKSESAAISDSKLISQHSIASTGRLQLEFCQPFIQSSNHNFGKEGESSILTLPIPNQSSANKHVGPISFKQSHMDVSTVEDSNFLNSNTRSLTNDAHFAGRTSEEVLLLDSGVTSEASNASSNCSDMSMNIIDEGTVNESTDFEQYFQKSCKPFSLSKSHESIEGSPCDVDKSEDDGDNDDMLGGVFAFSEEE